MEQETMKNSVGSSPTRGKPRFCEVCQQHHLDSHALQALADTAGVKKQVVDQMSVGTAVHRAHARSVLAALSTHTGKSWTLDNVQVRLLPTFQDYHAFHHFDLALLSSMSGVSFDKIDLMLRNEPVSTREARHILLAASKQTRLYYKFTNVDVALLDGDGGLIE
jgi:hypothetical protein